MKVRKFIPLFLVIFAIFLVVNLGFSFKMKEKNTTFGENQKIELKKGQSFYITSKSNLEIFNNFIEKEITSGNLKLFKIQTEEIGNYIHQRYNQYHCGIKVWGAQLIRHLKNGHIYCINGKYYSDINVSVKPSIGKNSALQIAKTDLGIEDYLLFEKPELVIFPEKKAYHLAYQIVFSKKGAEIIYFVDAHTGKIILKYDNTKTTATIGIGKGVHNDLKKMSTDYVGGIYKSRDKMRPALIKTYDMRYNWTVWSTYGYTDAYLGKDGDNDWRDKASNKPVVDGHCYTGWTYDYYYLVHNRKGLNNRDLMVKVFVNYDVWGVTNAFYDHRDHSINFYDGDGINTTYVAGAIDVVAHEYSHGVTDFTSNLIYWDESGALNEAFSDIMGACVEFYFQPEGKGFLKSDWLCGEDVYKSYGSNRAFRRFDKPYLLSYFGGPYPDHYSLKYTGPLDNRGVHINSCIVNHWFYLLSKGGTNRFSGITVSGIGISKAEKIVYRAWVFYLFPSADFRDARILTIQAAKDLYGVGSTESKRVTKAWNAVGVF
jgi:thermolysin